MRWPKSQHFDRCSLLTDKMLLCWVKMNQHNGNDDYAVTLKATSDAVNEANEWTAFVPFVLSKIPNYCTNWHFFYGVFAALFERVMFSSQTQAIRRVCMENFIEGLAKRRMQTWTWLVSLGSQSGSSKLLAAYFTCRVNPPSVPKDPNTSVSMRSPCYD